MTGVAFWSLDHKLSLLDVHHQRWLPPHGPALMFRVWLRPLAGRRVQPHVELPEQPGHYQAHLVVSQVLADAVPWAI